MEKSHTYYSPTIPIAIDHQVLVDYFERLIYITFFNGNLVSHSIVGKYNIGYFNYAYMFTIWHTHKQTQLLLNCNPPELLLKSRLSCLCNHPNV